VPPELAKAIAAAPAQDLTAALVPLLAAKATWPVREHGINDDGTVVGTITLAPVRDP